MTDDRLNLDELRAALAEVDGEIVRLAGRRLGLARQVGLVKDRGSRELRDFAQEKLVLERAREAARGEGIPGDLAADLMTLLIGSSLATQERQRVRSRRQGAGRRALVIGGAGRMGSWFARFLASQGFEVEIADPAATGGVGGFPVLADWRESPVDQELVVVAAPLRATADILSGLAARRPAGVIFDIGSLKSPLEPALRQLAEAGLLVTSLHPLFGPDTRLLSGRHVVVIDLGVRRANAAAEALFAPTMAEVVTMDLERHDRLMSCILGISHALNLAFLAALVGTGERAADLMRLSSTTFDRQLAVAGPVAEENPRLYFEIQSLNPYGLAALEGLSSAIERIRAIVRSGDEPGFVALMERGRNWVAERGPDEG